MQQRKIFPLKVGTNTTITIPFYSAPPVNESGILIKNATTFRETNDSTVMTTSINTKVHLTYYGHPVKRSGQRVVVRIFPLRTEMFGNYVLILTNNGGHKAIYSFNITEGIFTFIIKHRKTCKARYFFQYEYVLFIMLITQLVLCLNCPTVNRLTTT